MTDNSDYKLSRANLYKLLPDRHKTPFNKTLFENTFNRFLSKTEVQHVVGSIGSNAADQLPESTPHRQAFQLQPLMHASVATTDYTYSFRDVMNELSKMGVDISKFNDWGSVEIFNFAPPIDVDKLINYSDYFWIDRTVANPIPQYIVMRNPYNIASSRLYQKNKEINQTPVFDVLFVDHINNTFQIVGEYSQIFQVNSTFRVTGSGNVLNDGTKTVQSVSVSNNVTTITTSETVHNPLGTVYGQIDITVQSLPFEAEVTTEATNLSSNDNMWVVDNKWFHRNDIADVDKSFAIQAQFPIIEYVHTLEMNLWNKITYGWSYRESVNFAWVESETPPTMNDINDPEFHTKWLFNGIKSIKPCLAPPSLNPNPIVASSSASLCVPNTSGLLLSISDNHTVYELPNAIYGNYVLAGTDSIRVYATEGNRRVRQYNNYTEKVVTVGDINYVVGVIFDETQFGKDIEIEMGALALDDVGLENVAVRVSTSDTNNVDNISLMSWFRNEQVKNIGETKYPLFNIYDINDTLVDANPIFTFKEDSSEPVFPLLNKRIVFENSKPVFEQHLITVDNGVMLYYHDSQTVSGDNYTGAQSIWRTGDTQFYQYNPKLVDSKGRANGEVYFEDGVQYIAVVDESNGYWEIPLPWFNNAAHENRKSVTFSELVMHCLSIAKKQPIPNTFFTNQGAATRLQYHIDYGLGGTIKEHNESFDLLMSAVFTTANTPVTVIEFAGKQYETCLNIIKQTCADSVITALLNTTTEYVTNFDASFADEVITKYEQNDLMDSLYGDSSSFDGTNGIRNWIMTSPFMGFTQPRKPNLLKDEKLNVYKLRHHDNHLSDIHVNQTFIEQVQQIIVNTLLPQSPARKRGWMPGAPADYDDNITINEYVDIPYTKLLTNDYWLDETGLYRFEAIISATSPSLTNKIGSYWLRSDDGQLFVRVDENVNPAGWEAVVTSPYTLAAAWKKIDLTDIFANVLLEVETRLYEACPVAPIKWDNNNWVSQNDQFNFEQQMFLTYEKQRGITVPYVSDYTPVDAFTWNYSSVDVSSNTLFFPYTKDVNLWGARYHTIYENVFGTPYPHLEPWKLQGYKNKPTWWDEEYAGTTRRWSSQMWTNIKTGVLPAHVPAYDLPEGVNVLPTYLFVCVNTTDNTTTDGFGPDDLLPPYWVPPSGAPVDTALTNEVFIRNYGLIQAANVAEGYEFGDNGIDEWNWRHSLTYIHNSMVIGFLSQPVRFLHTLWGLNYISKGYLNVDQFSQRVPSHERTIFHGDIIDNVVYTANGLNQWYINLNRYLNNDTKSSDFRTLWNNWVMKYSYQVDTFIDPKSIDVRTSRFSIDEQDRTVVLKRTQDVIEKQIDSLFVTTVARGEYKIRNKNYIPLGSGHDWTFSIDNAPVESRTISYYGVKDYRITVSNLLTGTFTSNEPIAFETGDQITVYSSKILPTPLRDDQVYFLIKITPYMFRLADSYEDAITNTSIVLEDTGVGVHNLNRSITDFYAYGGQATANLWHHSEIDKSVIKTATFPFQITGVQNVINMIDGYAEMLKDEGFLIGYTDVTDRDPNTGLITSWQTEQERLIHTIYAGLTTAGSSNTSTNNVFTYTMDVSLNQIVLDDPSIVFNDGDEVFVHTSNSLPQGLVLNRTYYMIRVQPSLGRYKLASTKENALNNIPVFITTDGVGVQYLTMYDTSYRSLHETIEVNPFRNNIWLSTPTGIVSDVIKGPYDEIKATLTLYDQNAQVIDPDYVMVHRLDEITRVHVYPNIVNPNKPTTQSSYDNIHISGWKAFIDHFEHVIMFNDRLQDGTLVYDAFLGLGIPKVQVIFDVSLTSSKRPSFGGYFLKGDDLVRNIEGQIEDLGNMYSVYDARDSEPLTQHARRLLGYEETNYLNAIFADDKSKFVFWRGMIHQKGSSNVTEAFINSTLFEDTRIEEYWAYKVATFGPKTTKTYPTIKMKVSDTYRNDVKYDFNKYNNDSLVEEHFNLVNFKDFSRWVNLPDIRAMLPQEYNTIPLETEVHSIQKILATPFTYVQLNQYCDDVVIKIVDTGEILTEGVHYQKITNKLIKINDLPVDAMQSFSIIETVVKDQNDVVRTSFAEDEHLVVDSPYYLVFANGSMLKHGVDYLKQSFTSFKFLHDIEAQITIVYFTGTAVAIVNKQYVGNDVLLNRLPLPDEYNSTTTSLFIFSNGKLLEPVVDYTIVGNEIAFTVVFEANDDIELSVVGGRTYRETFTGAQLVSNGVSTKYKYKWPDVLMFVNGTLYNKDVDFDENLVLINNNNLADDDQITMIYNDELVNFSRNVEIFNMIPSKTKHSPLHIVDDLSKTTVSTPFMWDPARGFHNHLPLSYISLQSNKDPTRVIREVKKKSNNNASYTFETVIKDDGDTIRLVNPVSGDGETSNLLLFINGTKIRLGIDYTITDPTTVQLSTPVRATDDIVAVTINNVTVNTVHLSADTMTVSDTDPVEYTLSHYNKLHTAFVNDRLIFVNGKMVQYGVDYVDIDAANIKWLSVPRITSPADEIDIVYVDTVFSVISRTSNQANQINDTQSIITLTLEEMAEQPEILFVYVNGNIVPYTFQDDTIILDCVFVTATDEITVVYSGIYDIQNYVVTEWDSSKEGTIWWDTTKLGYKFYHDPVFYNDTNNILSVWGELADWASIDLYEWTRSSVPPEEYDNLAAAQEPNTTIPADERAAGIAKKSIKYNGEFIEGSRLTLNTYKVFYESEREFKISLTSSQKKIFSDTADVAVYVNQTNPVWMKMSQLDWNDYKEYDFLHIERNIKKTQYPRLTIDVGGGKTLLDDTGLVCDTSIMYTCTLVFNDKEYFLTVTAACTYEDLINNLNASVRVLIDNIDPTDAELITKPQTLWFSLDTDGNLQVEITKSNAATTLTIKDDTLFNKLTDYVSISDLLPFTITEEYDTGFEEVYHYLTVPKVNEGGQYNEYYFWVHSKSILQRGRRLSLNDIKQQLIKPTTQYFLLNDYKANDNVRSNYNNANVPRYNHLIIRNMDNIVTNDDRYSLVITNDSSLRDFDGYVKSPEKKQQFEEWKLFRQGSIVRIDEFLWKKLTESVMGISLDNFNKNIITPIPTYDRVLFDSINNTTSRYGIGRDQAFGDREQLLRTIVETIMENDTNVESINKVEFIQQYDLTNAVDVKEFMDQIYSVFPIETINRIFFECLNDLLAVQPKLKDIIKTSFISVHSVNTFDTVGSV